MRVTPVPPRRRAGGVLVGLLLALGASSSLGDGSFRTGPRYGWGTPGAPAPGKWRLSLEGESIGDTVAHAPNAEGGGFEPVRTKPRYAGATLALEWRPADVWQLRAALERRTLTSLRDSYTVDGLEIGLARRLPSPHPAIGLELTVDIDLNRAGELYKNSWTEIGGSRLSGARLSEVRDDTAMLGLGARFEVRPGTSLTALLGVGRIRATHARLAGTGTDPDGCRYAFEAAAGTGGLELLESCGNVVSFRESYADEGGIERRLGFSPSADLRSEAGVARAGVGLTHVAGRLVLSLDYVYARRDRGEFDGRIRAQGGRTVASSHATSLTVSLAATPALELGVGAHYRSTAYLDELPLLYNAFTSRRFLENVLAFSVGVTYSF